jgi:D-sedoheptulose 7-phosphate isomerase
LIHRGDFGKRVRQSIEASIAVKQLLLNDAEVLATTARVSELLVEALTQGKKPILFGNGGSAADAQHIAAELVGRFAFDRPALPALALSVNSSCLTAIGNDYGFDVVFARQIEALGRPGDVAIGISTGASGGALKAAVDHCICVPSSETPRIQECHILIGHIISELVEETIFQDKLH